MLIKVRVRTKAKKETIREISSGKYDVSVTEPPAENRANDRVKAMLAALFGVEVKLIRLHSGHHHQSKTFEVPKK